MSEFGLLGFRVLIGLAHAYTKSHKPQNPSVPKKGLRMSAMAGCTPPATALLSSITLDSLCELWFSAQEDVKP